MNVKSFLLKAGAVATTAAVTSQAYAGDILDAVTAGTADLKSDQLGISVIVIAAAVVSVGVGMALGLLRKAGR